jgi:hypothetical protein
MKKFLLSATVAAAMAATLAGCNRSPYYGNGYYAGQNTSICTNQFHQRVPDYECNGSYGNAFVWYYLGRSSVVPYYGQTVFGGGYTRTAGATYFHAPVAANVTRSVAVSRGGFGSSARTYSAPVGSSISSYSSSGRSSGFTGGGFRGGSSFSGGFGG